MGVTSQRKLVSLPQAVHCMEAIIKAGKGRHGALFQLCLLGNKPSRVNKRLTRNNLNIHYII